MGESENQLADVRRRRGDMIKGIVALFIFMFIDGLVIFLPETATAHVAAAGILVMTIALIVAGCRGLKRLKVEAVGSDGHE